MTSSIPKKKTQTTQSGSCFKTTKKRYMSKLINYKSLPFKADEGRPDVSKVVDEIHGLTKRTPDKVITNFYDYRRVRPLLNHI